MQGTRSFNSLLAIKVKTRTGAAVQHYGHQKEHDKTTYAALKATHGKDKHASALGLIYVGAIGNKGGVGVWRRSSSSTSTMNESMDGKVCVLLLAKKKSVLFFLRRFGEKATTIFVEL